MPTIISGAALIDVIEQGNVIENGNSANCDSIKYDFSLDPTFLKAKYGRPVRYDELSPTEQENAVIEPGEMVYVLTKETLNLPNNIYLQMSPKRLLAEAGVVTLGGLTVDPGYHGKLIFGLYNFSSKPVVLVPGRKLVSAVFYKLDNIEVVSTNQITPPKAVYDFPPSLIEMATKDPRIGIHSFEDVTATIAKQLEYLDKAFTPVYNTTSKRKTSPQTPSLINPEFDSLGGNAHSLKELTKLVRKNRIIPFVGAGMSVDVYGGWGEALGALMDGHLFDEEAEKVKALVDDREYEKAASIIRDELGETGYYDQLDAIFGETRIPKDASQTLPVRYLPKIWNDNVVITTNFDKILEKIFQSEECPFLEKVVLRHLTEWQARKIKRGNLHYLIKVHGCVSAPDEVVMTEEQYNALYSKPEGLMHIQRLRDILGSNTLLFLGCSLNVDRTVKLLREVGLGDHYAIMEMNGEANDPAFRERKRYMSNELRMHCIWYPKGEHHYVEKILAYIYSEKQKS